MKIKRDKFYLYIGYAKSETKWTWDIDVSKPGYLWLLVDIGIFWRKMMLTLRIGKCQKLTKQGLNEAESGKSGGISNTPTEKA